MSDFGDVTRPRTRKHHDCIWCGQNIPKGEISNNFRGMFQGQWQNWYMHDECYEDYEDSDYCDGEGFEPYSNDRPKPKEVTK